MLSLGLLLRSLVDLGTFLVAVGLPGPWLTGRYASMHDTNGKLSSERGKESNEAQFYNRLDTLSTLLTRYINLRRQMCLRKDLPVPGTESEEEAAHIATHLLKSKLASGEVVGNGQKSSQVAENSWVDTAATSAGVKLASNPVFQMCCENVAGAVARLLS